ncbi:hypothetical protein GCM10010284_66880 [Streptomyces rubiginosohelvolus]|uniref:hypothetical protein n=1 Tax=Streptomyces rubiginosohelvolus TaxID=67362 RepID=UPI001671E6B2|nr:hypothetical protein [Streptomyces rubiginosohelvolus]GGS24565.1 hypothetical protein GCM10010284_66880 [Streptomyces rubiginosohelvolus]
MPADLHTRYMEARRTWADHADDCDTCTPTQPGCPDGTPLWERFSRLQDAYLTHLRKKGAS